MLHFGLRPHRMAFTGLAYQYFAICGAGSNDPGGGNDCRPADAKGVPTLSPGHPYQTPPDLGAQLTAPQSHIIIIIINQKAQHLDSRCVPRCWRGGHVSIHR